MSFVRQILASASEFETHEVQGKLNVLTKEISSLKVRVNEEICRKFADFQPISEVAESLSDSVERISKEMLQLEEKIETEVKSLLKTSTGVVHSLKDQWSEASDILCVLESLAKIQDGLECLSSANSSQNFSNAATSILEIHELLTEELGTNQNIKILSALRTEFCIQKEQFKMDICQRWKSFLHWDIQEDSESKQMKYQLTMPMGDKLVVFKNLVEALLKLDMLDAQFKQFGSNVVKCLISPCITYCSTNVEIETHTNSQVLTVTVNESSEESSACEPKMVFTKVLTILKLMNDSCLHVTVDTSNSKGQTCQYSLMSMLGSSIAESILELIVKQSLTPSIPTSSTLLEQYQTSISRIEGFHKHLLEMKFITPANSTLLDFLQNVNVLFVNKKCQELLTKARDLMRMDIHNIVSVTNDKPLGDLPSLGSDGPSNKKVKKLDLAGECRLSENTFLLPACHVSVSIQQLLLMAYETLHEATDSSPQCAIQMFYAVRNIFELFCSVFPTYHKKSLQSFPQLSAIFYNNCMFISHHLMTLGHQFREKLPSSMNTTFVDLVPKIRGLGTEIFLQQLSKQKMVLREYLEGAQDFVNVAEDGRFVATERSIKQVILQFQHLQKVWQDVLPPSNYKKAIGTLLKSVVIDITGCIVTLEDISSEDANHLAAFLTNIVEKAGDLMKTPNVTSHNAPLELQRNVPKWLRFKELINVLNASLLEISDRWAEGKGPLAVEFSPNEMKQLIRALFQNTERRANILSKIKG